MQNQQLEKKQKENTDKKEKAIMNEFSDSNQQNGQSQINEKDNKGDQQQKLSKKQLKKQQKKQKWQQIKRQKRKQQRQKQKQKKKLKKQQKKEQKVMTQEPLAQEKKENQIPKKRKEQYKQKMIDGLKVVIDLQFYDLMTQKQKTSLGKQLAYCHSVNRKAEKCFNYIITSATENRMKFLNEKYNIDNFGITIIENDLIDSFEKDKIVYLTGDAEQQLQQFDPSQIYIIGGIVDHNRLKKITINYAVQKGIKARRLPMKGLKLKASVHLAVNHVWQWMLRYYNGSTWIQSIKAVIPERKLQQQKVEQ